MYKCVERLQITKLFVQSLSPDIELTDGWYCLPAILDKPLQWQLARNKIVVGSKLLICGATVVGNSEPAHPLEVWYVL